MKDYKDFATHIINHRDYDAFFEELFKEKVGNLYYTDKEAFEEEKGVCKGIEYVKTVLKNLAS